MRTKRETDLERLPYDLDALRASLPKQRHNIVVLQKGIADQEAQIEYTEEIIEVLEAKQVREATILALERSTAEAIERGISE